VGEGIEFNLRFVNPVGELDERNRDVNVNAHVLFSLPSKSWQ